MTVHFENINSKENLLHGKRPFLIAGPCSAESREQVTEAARALAAIEQVDAFRCGLWKPRTRLGGFEGVGNEGLEWLKEVKENTRLKVCVEVATAKHVEACLDYGIDMLWIGSRTTGNPFSVNELATALRGMQIPILVKNPMTPDIKLWIGAIERLYVEGSLQLMAVLRGFHLNSNDIYRNSPCWEIGVEFKRIAPEIPFICDPSHIGGRRSLIKALSQTAMDLAFDGLMIEVHPNPENALTDADQQITPNELKELIDELVIRSVNDMSAEDNLALIRSRIDTWDSTLLHALGERMKLSRQATEYKKVHNMAILQMKRWDKILTVRLQEARKENLDAEFVKKIFEQIHLESIRIQDEILNKIQK